MHNNHILRISKTPQAIGVARGGGVKKILATPLPHAISACISHWSQVFIHSAKEDGRLSDRNRVYLQKGRLCKQRCFIQGSTFKDLEFSTTTKWAEF